VKHGAALFKLCGVVHPFDRHDGWWFGLGVDIAFDEANVLRPDLAGWRRTGGREALQGQRPTSCADWVCEILSTGRNDDLIKKKRVYHRHQVAHCWIVDPAEQMLSVLRWVPDGWLEIVAAERGEEVRAEPFKAMALKVGVLFGDEDEEL
jgi:Uma2 family endonuclease